MIRSLYHIVRIVLGVVFIVSAYLKLFPIEPFELFVFEQGFLNWELSSVLTRGILATEFFIGIMLIVNIFPRFINLFNIVFLVGFTFFLVYLAVFKPEISNCNCFGEQFELSPLSSIFKNIAMILSCIFLLKFEYKFQFRYQKHLAIIILVVNFAFPHIVSPADFVYYGSLGQIEREVDLSVLKTDTTFTKKDFDINIPEKQVICFFSTGCQYCKLAARKLSIIDNSTEQDLPIKHVFLGDGEKYSSFIKESRTNVYPYKFLPIPEFFTISGSSLPKIMLVDQGEVKYEGGYREISKDQILDFLEN